MPEVVIHLVEGRAPEKKRAVMKDITDSIVQHFGVDPEAVVIQIVESSRADKMKGGKLFSERTPSKPATA